MARDYSKYRRKIYGRSPKERILIVCEGKKTEPNYFKGFRVTSAHIKYIGEGLNTTSLIQRAKDEIAGAKSQGYIYDQVWCVFDKDSVSDQQFNDAIKQAGENGFKVAYSNEAFELWYLLHFEYRNTPMGRDQYKTKLTARLGQPYQKNDKEMYDKLLAFQPTAIANAKRLLADYGTGNPAKDNPSTTVYLLVEELNKFR